MPVCLLVAGGSCRFFQCHCIRVFSPFAAKSLFGTSSADGNYSEDEKEDYSSEVLAVLYYLAAFDGLFFRNDFFLFKIDDEMRDENRSHSVDSAGGEESGEEVRVW